MPFDGGALSEGKHVQITVVVNIVDGWDITAEIVKIGRGTANICGQIRS